MSPAGPTCRWCFPRTGGSPGSATRVRVFGVANTSEGSGFARAIASAELRDNLCARGVGRLVRRRGARPGGPIRGQRLRLRATQILFLNDAADSRREPFALDRSGREQHLPASGCGADARRRRRRRCRAHLDAVSRALGGSRLARVLITHSHPDHAGGVPALLARWPEVSVRISRRTAAATARSSSPATGGWSRCTPPATRRTTSASSTKRHATSTVATSPGVEERSSSPPARAATSRNTSHRCAASADLAPARLLPGHGPIIEDVAELIDEYLKHRAEREEQVLEALASGCETVGQLVDRIYSGLHPSVVPAAADSVLAHLIKLRDEGKVVESDGSWRVVV